jgi:hypothetical protein
MISSRMAASAALSVNRDDADRLNHGSLSRLQHDDDDLCYCGLRQQCVAEMLHSRAPF